MVQVAVGGTSRLARFEIDSHPLSVVTVTVALRLPGMPT